MQADYAGQLASPNNSFKVTAHRAARSKLHFIVLCPLPAVGGTLTQALGLMPNRAVYINSYFSLATDLAAQLRDWPEFVSGHEYTVQLRSAEEAVSTSLEDDGGAAYVLVKGFGEGPLFFRVLGATIYLLAGHSDDVWPRVMRWENDEPVPFQRAEDASP